jgi:hypothetical protein
MESNINCEIKARILKTSMLMQVMSSYTLIFVMMMFPVGESAFSLLSPCSSPATGICHCPVPIILSFPGTVGSRPVPVSAPHSSMGCLFKCFTIHPNYETS